MTEHYTLTLKGLKIIPELSEETLAFTAALLANGECVGVVENHGTGGCHVYIWNDRASREAIEGWAEEMHTEYNFEKLDQIINGLVEQRL